MGSAGFRFIHSNLCTPRALTARFGQWLRTKRARGPAGTPKSPAASRPPARCMPPWIMAERRSRFSPPGPLPIYYLPSCLGTPTIPAIRIPPSPRQTKLSWRIRHPPPWYWPFRGALPVDPRGIAWPPRKLRPYQRQGRVLPTPPHSGRTKSGGRRRWYYRLP